MVQGELGFLFRRTYSFSGDGADRAMAVTMEFQFGGEDSPNELVQSTVWRRVGDEASD